MKRLTKGFVGIVQIAFVGSFLLMVINIMFYYGFRMEIHHPENATKNPFGMELWQIWLFHLTSGMIAGICLNSKRYFLAGICGMLAAALVTGISFAYLGWREDLELIEVLLPLIVGILPAVKLFDLINKRFPLAHAAVQKD